MESKQKSSTINFVTLFNTSVLILIIILLSIVDSKFTDFLTKLNIYISISIVTFSIFSFHIIKKRELGGAIINYLIIPLLIFLLLIGFLSIKNFFPQNTDHFDIFLFSILIVFMLFQLIKNHLILETETTKKNEKIKYENVCYLNIKYNTIFSNSFEFFMYFIAVIGIAMHILDSNKLLQYLKITFYLLILLRIIYQNKEYFEIKKDYLAIDEEVIYFSNINKFFHLSDIISIYIYNNCIEIKTINSDNVDIYMKKIKWEKAIEIMDYIKSNNKKNPKLRLGHSF